MFDVFSNFRELSGNFGLRWDVVKTHPPPMPLNFSRPKTDEEMKVLQGYVEGIYDRFVQVWLRRVGDWQAKVREIAEGRVWMGTDAKEKELVDEFGGLKTAITKAIDLADFKKDLEIEEFPKIESYDVLGEWMEVRTKVRVCRLRFG